MFVCMLYVVLLVLVYMGHFYIYSTWLQVVDYDIHHYLFNMIYVLWLVIFSNLCRGGYAEVFLVPVCITIINVHVPDLILLVHMLSIAGRLATIK